MTNRESILIKTLERLNNKQSAALVIQMCIQVNGPLSEEAGAKVRELLEGMHE